jgi:hypothetical protein
MKVSVVVLLLFGFLPHTKLVRKAPAESIPAIFKGKFTDDYGIKYTITDSLWTQHPRTKFHVIKWNIKEQYLIARNDLTNPGEGGLYTRIDFMQFNKMEPWLWGYCLSVYNASSDKDAEEKGHTDRDHPKTGCNGFPFSRMKRIE